jgi:hypothetical protein
VTTGTAMRAALGEDHSAETGAVDDAFLEEAGETE